MRILMIGGTRFVGRHMVEAALTAGHDVTIFHRGKTGPDLFPEAEHRLGDRNADLDVLADGTWDATIDVCGYFPRQVHSLADALDGRGGQHVFISSVSAYANPGRPNFREDSPLAHTDDPDAVNVTNDNYGGLKVLCERAALAAHGARTLVVRPTYVVGPDDYTWRFPSWIQRIAQGGDVLLPGPSDDHAQIIDGRDMAAWIVAMVADGHGGTYHAVAPTSSYTWGDLMAEIVDAVAPAGATATWVDEAFLLGQGLNGEVLPMWAGGSDDRLLSAADPSAAYEVGLRPRPIRDTILDTLAWINAEPSPPPPRLSPTREAELLATWRAGS